MLKDKMEANDHATSLSPILENKKKKKQTQPKNALNKQKKGVSHDFGTLD